VENKTDFHVSRSIPGGRRYSHHKDGHLQLNLVVIGLDFVANEFIGKIHLNCNDNGEYLIDGQTYVLNIETINRENDSYSFDLQSKGEWSTIRSMGSMRSLFRVG
jgi:hypothetical protein